MPFDEASSTERAPFAEGSILRAVMVGPPVRNRVASWHRNERRLWVLDDRDTAEDLIGMGHLARTLREPHRFREVVLVSDDETALIAVERPVSTDDHSVATGSIILATTPVELEPKDNSKSSWNELADWLSEVVLVAASRGEFVVAEVGGEPFTDEPYVLAFAAGMSHGDRMHLERAPADLPAAGWPPSDQPEGHSISVPISKETQALVGYLMVASIRTWAESPHDVCVTFGRPPSG